MSASRPKGTRVIAAAKIKDVATQLKDKAVMDSSLAIKGNATLTADPINGVRNELRVVANRRMYSCFLVMKSQHQF
jgi:hypothetical protein